MVQWDRAGRACPPFRFGSLTRFFLLLFIWTTFDAHREWQNDPEETKDASWSMTCHAPRRRWPLRVRKWRVGPS